MLEILKTIIIGIIEGITEWLPISSTGHIILASEWMNFLTDPASADFKEVFDVVIQLGAIMAVVILFFNKLWPFKKKTKSDPGMIKMDIMQLWFKVIVGSLPLVIALALNDWVDEHFFNYTTVSVTLIVYGILFIVIENYNKNRKPKVRTFSEMSYQLAFLIGLFQVLAIIPGTSRSGATILGAMLFGTSRYIAAEYSFYLAIPAMFGASFLKLIKFVLNGCSFTGLQIAILSVGTIVSFLVSIFAIKFLMGYIKKKDFKAFGYYRIILGLIVIVYFFVCK